MSQSLQILVYQAFNFFVKDEHTTQKRNIYDFCFCRVGNPRAINF